MVRSRGRLVSGLARGIDGRAHQGRDVAAHKWRCCRAPWTPSIRACTKGWPKPSWRRWAASDQPPGVQVERASRNRILTGVAPATVVIQSPRAGGSLISARCAFDQNREVFALWQQGMLVVVGWWPTTLAMPVADVMASSQGRLGFPEGGMRWTTAGQPRGTSSERRAKAGQPTSNGRHAGVCWAGFVVFRGGRFFGIDNAARAGHHRNRRTSSLRGALGRAPMSWSATG